MVLRSRGVSRGCESTEDGRVFTGREGEREGEGGAHPCTWSSHRPRLPEPSPVPALYRTYQPGSHVRESGAIELSDRSTDEGRHVLSELSVCVSVCV